MPEQEAITARSTFSIEKVANILTELFHRQKWRWVIEIGHLNRLTEYASPSEWRRRVHFVSDRMSHHPQMVHFHGGWALFRLTELTFLGIIHRPTSPNGRFLAKNKGSTRLSALGANEGGSDVSK
jgi:hypothetical protein